MERHEVERIVEQKLRELNLEKLFRLFIQEHSGLDGRHKENIGKYVHYDDIQGTP